MNGQRRIRLAANLSLLLLVFGCIWAWQPQKAEAACGASTSSCKTCHEVKGEDPVSKKGDWHTQHAFGDFCQACHGGVATASDKTQAHSGVVAKPLEKSQETCASCHPSDTAARVAKYGGSASAGTSAAPAGEVKNTGTADQSSNKATVSEAAKQIPPSENANYDLIDFNKYGKSISKLAWAIVLLDLILFVLLFVMVWRWKTGVWPWIYLKRNKDKDNWVNLNNLPIEGQQLIKRLLHTNQKVISVLNKFFEESKNEEELLESLEQSKALKNQANELTSINKEGKDHVL